VGRYRLLVAFRKTLSKEEAVAWDAMEDIGCPLETIKQAIIAARRGFHMSYVDLDGRNHVAMTRYKREFEGRIAHFEVKDLSIESKPFGISDQFLMIEMVFQVRETEASQKLYEQQMVDVLKMQATLGEFSFKLEDMKKLEE